MKSASLVDHRGIPPLAGLFTYEEAERPGLSVDEAAGRLWRFAYACRRLHALGVAALPGTPEWEAKCALGLHLWLDAQHATALEQRVNELRHPSVDVSSAPDERIAIVFDELEHFDGTLELLTGVYEIVRTSYVRGLHSYLSACNPLADYPSFRIIELILRDEERSLSWGLAAAAGLRQHAERRGGEDAAVSGIAEWKETLQRLIDAAGGIAGDEPSRDAPTERVLRCTRGPAARCWDVRRDARFQEPYNESADIDAYYDDASRPAAERTFALAYKRLREMDVPEWMAPIIGESEEQPWERRVELSRQLWDEVRHAMMGEVALHHHGVAFYSFPVPLKASTVLNSEFTPAEAHLMLWKIEQDLMAANTGKKHEVEIARAHGDPLLAMFQDFDWADEILHARTGRRWIVESFPSRAEAEKAATEVMTRYRAIARDLVARHDQTEWWHEFVAAMRKGGDSRAAA